MYDITCSIVIYNTDIKVLQHAVTSFLSTALNVKLYLIDNSPTDHLKNIVADPRIIYIHNPANPGYGSAHNIALQKSLSAGARYHLVMNPDIYFDPGTIENIYAYMNDHTQVGSLMPKVFYEDGTLQRLCKLLPAPLNLIGRRFMGNTSWARKKNAEYELHHFNYNAVLNTPCLSGCFMFIRTAVLKTTGLFDSRYFMYMEDYDLTRRIHTVAETIFYPGVSITHGHAKESYRNGALLKIHMHSAIKYFNKWGWINDKQRQLFNQKVLQRISIGVIIDRAHYMIKKTT